MAGLFGAALRRPRPTALEEAEWVQATGEGDVAARNRLVEANLWAVIFIARRFRGHGVEMADLIQEGLLGLLGAIPYFDVDQGTRLATFAMPRVRTPSPGPSFATGGRSGSARRGTRPCIARAGRSDTSRPRWTALRP